jgi:hypothetical protein
MINAADQKLIAEIKRILTSKLNDFVVGSIIRVNCKRIGVEPEELNQEKLPEFLEKIEVSLLLFLTKEEISEVVQKIKEIKI